MLSARLLWTVLHRARKREDLPQEILLLITCLASRALHLEVAYGLDTNFFLNAFFRMVSRRGLPGDVLSDNGTNFVVANNELEELVALVKEKIQEKTASYGIKWPFNPHLTSAASTR